MRKLVALGLAGGALMVVWGATGAAAGRDIDIAWSAVRTLWSWQKFWYGSIDAERCFKRWVGKRVHVTFRQFPLTSYRAGRLPATPCEGCSGEGPRVESMRVQIEDTVLKYRVDAASPGPGGLEKKAYATILEPDPPGCRDAEETRRWNERYRVEGVPAVTETRLLRVIEPHRLPPVEENLRDEAVLKFVQRSIAYSRPPRPSDPPPAGRPPKPVSPERLAQIAGSRTVLVGRFSRSDPFLLLWYQGDDTVYQLEFPGPDVLADEKMCVFLFGAPSSQVPDTKEERMLKAKLAKNSIVVEVPTAAR